MSTHQSKARIEHLLRLLQQLDVVAVVDGYYLQRSNPAPGLLLKEAIRDAEAAVAWMEEK